MYFMDRTLYRIKALKDFSNVVAGELGGWIEKEENLSQEGNAWVADDAKVCGDSLISNNALVSDNAIVSGNVNVLSNAHIFENAEIYGDTVIDDKARVYGEAQIYDAVIYDNARVYGNATIRNAAIINNVEIFGDAVVDGEAELVCDAKVSKQSDYIVFKNFWSSGRYFTWIRSNNMWKVGCFYGTGEELIKKAYQDSEKSGREYERVVRYVESILADENKR